jgi:AraC family transcriptional regulator of adaptative response / DNA-3-methyladenine glycosylase II
LAENGERGRDGSTILADMIAAETCYEALRARDARFDGLFFVGVKSTGIYCRSVCTARTPKPASCRFFETAAAAEKAGFRPCLLCRPELAPAHLAPERSLAHAIGARLQATAVEAGSVEELARRSGFSTRHLRRLVRTAFGVTPVELAQTHRLLFAKKLLQETALPISEVALQAGFRSLRRFHALYAARYGFPPSRLRREAGVEVLGALRLRLAYRPPLAWEQMLRYLAARAIPGVEAVVGRHYLRTIALGAKPAWLRVGHDPERRCLVVEFSPEAASNLYPALHRLRAVFDLDANPERIAEKLAADPLLRAALAHMPGLRVAGAWDAFEIAVRTILGQQISVAGASTICGRLVARFGTAFATPHAALTHLFPKPEILAEADLSSIAGLGLPARRAETIREMARAVIAGALDFLPGTTSEDAVARLKSLPGIGEWTAQYLAMRLLRSPDAFPAGDLGLRKAGGRGTPISEAALLARAEAWRPWRAYAAVYLWHSLSLP